MQHLQLQMGALLYVLVSGDAFIRPCHPLSQAAILEAPHNLHVYGTLSRLQLSLTSGGQGATTCIAEPQSFVTPSVHEQ